MAPFVGGGGCGHDTAVADVLALEEWGRRWRVSGVGHVYRCRGEREVWRRSWGEGDEDMGRWWRMWPRSGERERRERGLGELSRRLGERELCEWGLWAAEAP